MRAARALREQWARAATESGESGWPADETDWYCAAVDALCRGLLDANGARPDVFRASSSLGAARADAGAQLDEARRDLDIVLALARVTYSRRLQLLDALTVGWAERAVSRLSTPQIIDPRSEMATLDYLMLRLRELYSAAALTGESVADKYLLVVVEIERSQQRLVSEARLSALHSALQYAFVGGESIVASPPRRVLALVPSDEPQLSDSLARLRSELKIAIAEGRLPKTRCWGQSLPRDPVELSLILLDLAD